MTSILFERTKNVYLPEISAYRQFLARYYPNVKTYDTGDIGDYDPLSYDCIWRFMGLDRKGEGHYIVHEYNSLSTGRAAPLKNLIKKSVNAQPDYRVFLNGTVQQGFNFKDKVPYGLRDMGIDPRFFVRPSALPIYDFVYAGSLDRGVAVTKILDQFKNLSLTILIVGSAPTELQRRYEGNRNIIFKGRVKYEEVPALMAQARFGLNIMPDLYPFNVQTATKVLEYCALGLRVVSTRYEWAEKFVQERKANFFWLEKNFSNLTRDNIDKFIFSVPDVSDLQWDSIIKKSNIFGFL